MSATLHGEGTVLSRVQVVRDFREHATAAYAVLAEGNLLTLRHGDRAKWLTLPPEDVAAAVDVYAARLAEAVPMVSPATGAHRVTRADASVTWRLPDDLASRALESAREHLGIATSGRRVTARYGSESVFSRITKKLTVRAYDKTAETLNSYKGTGYTPNLGEGRLVRLEVQTRSDHCRSIYGDDLASLAALGDSMARKTLNQWTEIFSGAATTATVRSLASQLVEMGASPAEALRLVGPAIVLAEGGVPALMQMGLSEASAYRLRARLRELKSGGGAPGEIELVLDAAEFAGRES